MNLFIGLFLLLGASNAFILDAEDKLMERIEKAIEDTEEVTLREYLDDLDEPDPVTRGAEECVEACKKKKIASPDLKKCQKKKFKPDYEKDGCKCLIGYKCCQETCPDQSLDKCKEGMTYGVLIPDCCGCDQVDCIECQKPQTKEEMCAGIKKAPACYTYREHGRKADDTKCWESTCEENASDAPKQECAMCQNESKKTSTCGFVYNTCRLIDECPYNNIESQKPSKPLECYENPKRVDDTENGHFFDKSTKECSLCQKYEWTKISCEAKNKAAYDHDCNKDSIYDKSCIKKSIQKDQCGCDEAVCTKLPEEEALMGNDVHCPKNYVRLKGEALCGAAREICFPCPELEPKESVQCDGTVLADKDINNCPTWSCLPEEKFTCNDNSPLTKDKLCDGNKDCKDGEDDLNCNESVLKTSRFRNCFHFPDYHDSSSGDHECKSVEMTPKNHAKTDDFTVDLWYKYTKKTDTATFVGSSRFSFTPMYKPKTARVNMDGGSVKFSRPNTPDVGTYERVTVTKKGSSFTLYIDGKKKEELNLKNKYRINLSGKFFLGQQPDDDTYWEIEALYGSICDFQMWNRALTKAELDDLFQPSTYSKVERGNVFDSPPSYKYEIKSCTALGDF